MQRLVREFVRDCDTASLPATLAEAAFALVAPAAGATKAAHPTVVPTEAGAPAWHDKLYYVGLGAGVGLGLALVFGAAATWTSAAVFSRHTPTRRSA